MQLTLWLGVCTAPTAPRPPRAAHREAQKWAHYRRSRDAKPSKFPRLLDSCQDKRRNPVGASVRSRCPSMTLSLGDPRTYAGVGAACSCNALSCRHRHDGIPRTAGQHEPNRLLVLFSSLSSSSDCSPAWLAAADAKTVIIVESAGALQKRRRHSISSLPRAREGRR